MTMSTGSVYEIIWPYPTRRFGSGGNTAAVITLDSITPSQDQIAFRFRAGKSGNIKKFHFYTTTVTTGATMDIECQGVDANGDPDGTPLTNGTTTLVIADADDNAVKTATFATAFAVTAGTTYAAVMKAPGSGSLNMQIRAGFQAFGGARGTNVVMSALNAAAWTVNNIDPMVFAAEYDDASFAFIRNTMPFNNPSNVTYNSGSSPAIHGNRFRFPGPIRVSGFWCDISLASATASDFVVHIYNSSGTSLMSRSYEAAYIDATSANTFADEFGDTEDLAANTDYYIAIAPSSANSVTIQRFDTMVAATPAMLDQTQGGQQYCAATLSGGTWTHDTDSRYLMGIIFSGIDDGAGGGSSGRGMIF